MIYWKIGEITPILHCKIIQQFCNFFLLFLISMHQKPHIFHLCGYLQHMKLFLARNNAFLNLSHFLGIIFDFSPLKEEANPMVVTSVVTYTFPIGPFLGAPSSRYGPSVDWGVIVNWTRWCQKVHINQCAMYFKSLQLYV